jgi:glycosyltransferase involved in cell wall biosynthesis
MNAPLISVVIPVYKSAESLEELALRLTESLTIITNDFEVILVNDGSPDNSWEIISKISLNDSRFVGIRLSRNFGQHPAITSGLKFSSGTWVVVMDCDLQDRPEEIPKLYEKAQEGFEQVVATRNVREDSWFKRKSARIYVGVLSHLSGQRINPSVGNFGVYHRSVVDVITSLKEQGRTFGLLALWAGFRRTEVEVTHVARPYGVTSYSYRALIRLGLLGIISHSDKPLKLTIKFGAYLSAASLLGGSWIVLRQIIWGYTPIGWTSVMVSITFMTGILLGSIGVAGLYIAQIFDEVKERPTSVIWETTRDTHPDNS